MRNILYSIVWILIYLLLILAPIFVLMIEPDRAGRESWREFSVALGFAGLSMMGTQFLLTARFGPVVRPFGIDVVYHFHRQISLVGFLFVLAHPIILFIFNPDYLALLNPLTAPARAVYGLASIIAFLIIIFLSLRRLNINLKYEPWRITHGFFATAAIILAMLHVLGVGYYINTPGKQVLWLALSAVWIGSLLYVRTIKPLMMLNRPYVIEELRPEKGDSYTLVFKPEGHKGMRFRPGQFAWLTVKTSPYNYREHPFSLSSSAMVSEKVELTIKELGDFTSQVKELQPGTRAYLDGPYGYFSIDYHPAKGYIFLAGGVGITPVISILRTMADRRDTRPVILFYGSRSWEDTTFAEEINDLTEMMNLKVIFVLEEAHEGWDGPVGYITAELIAKHLPDQRMDYLYFMCGPEIMMHVVGGELDRLGIPDDRIISEHFNFV
jgi:predicted ferric reductase